MQNSRASLRENLTLIKGNVGYRNLSQVQVSRGKRLRQAAMATTKQKVRNNVEKSFFIRYTQSKSKGQPLTSIAQHKPVIFFYSPCLKVLQFHVNLLNIHVYPQNVIIAVHSVDDVIIEAVKFL